MALSTLFKKASNLLGFVSPDHARPAPLDGEIIYCKNNVCVHPPAVLRADSEHFPGYLNIRSQEDDVLGSTLILTWIPNSTLQKNPRSIENSPAATGPRVSPRRSPRQEYAKSDESLKDSADSDSTGADLGRGSAGDQGSDSPSPGEGVGRDGEASPAARHGGHGDIKNNARGDKDATVVPGVGTNVNALKEKETNLSNSRSGGGGGKRRAPSLERDSREGSQETDGSDKRHSTCSVSSSDSESVSTELQLFQLLNRGKVPPPAAPPPPAPLRHPVTEQVRESERRKRSSSSRSVTSIEMEGDNLVIVTEELDDSAFDTAEDAPARGRDTAASHGWKAPTGPPAGDVAVTTEIGNVRPEETSLGDDVTSCVREAERDDLGFSERHSVSSSSDSSHPSPTSPRYRRMLSELAAKGLNDTTDALTSQNGEVIEDVKDASEENNETKSKMDKLKESLDLKLNINNQNDGGLCATNNTLNKSPIITVNDRPRSATSSCSSTPTSGPDSEPSSPVTPPEYARSPPSLSSDGPGDHVAQFTYSSPEVAHATYNFSFPENTVTFSNSPVGDTPKSPKSARDQVCGVFSVDLGQMRSLRIFYSDSKCSCGQLVIASRESQYKILHFHHGGLDRLVDTLSSWKFLAQPSDGVGTAGDVTLPALGARVLDALADWNPVTAFTRKDGEQLSNCKHFSVIRPYLTDSQCHPEEGAYEKVNEETWKQHMNELGQIEDDFHLRKAIFFAGLESSVRHEMWPFLLHYYPYSSTFEEREQIRNDKYIEYQNLRKMREAMHGEEKEFFFKVTQSTVEKDVVRTDRSHTYFKGEDNPNIEILKNILLHYAVAHPHYGYTQGMSDLLAPVLEEVQKEVDAYWCFVGLMQKTIFVSSPKDIDMDKQLDYLRELLRIMLPKFHAHLHRVQDGLELLFVHRWILLCFKREFAEDDALKMWEACWAHYQTDYFHLFICVAIIAVYGEDVASQDLPADEMLLHFSSLSMHMNSDVILKKARGLLHQFRTLPKIYCTLEGLCTLCSPGMWDSGHVPTIECVGNHADDSCPYGGKAPE